MYRILCDGEPVFIPTVEADEYKVLSPKMNSELNKADTLSFVLPPSNRAYNSIIPLASTVTAYDDDEVIFHGRCVDTHLGFYNTKTITCEGALGWLHDSVVRPYSYYSSSNELFDYIVANHNNQVPSERQMQPRTDWSYTTRQTYTNGEYMSTFDFLKPRWWETALAQRQGLGSLIASYEDDGQGNITTYLDARQNSAGQDFIKIQLGVNIIDVNEYIDASGVYTRIIPLGAKVGDDYTTIAPINGGIDYLDNADAIAANGIIAKVVRFPEISNATTLRSTAQTALDKSVTAIRSVDINAIITHDMSPDPSWHVKLGREYQVYSPPHGIDEWLQCTRIERDLSRPDGSKYTFGTPRQPLSAK